MEGGFNAIPYLNLKTSITYHVILSSSFPLGGVEALEVRASQVFSAILPDIGPPGSDFF